MRENVLVVYWRCSLFILVVEGNVRVFFFICIVKDKTDGDDKRNIEARVCGSRELLRSRNFQIMI